MTTFRSVVKPNEKLVSTDLTGTLDLEDKFNSVTFSAAQSANISTLTNTAHLIDGQTVRIHNTGASDVIIDGSLMEDGLAVDIEQDTTSLLFYIKTTGKFKDQGGTARIKDLEVNFAAHDHDGVDAPQVIATNLDSGASTSIQYLRSDGAGGQSWENVPGVGEGRAQVFSTDTTTNLTPSDTVDTEVPLTGTTERLDTGYTISGNGIQVGFTGRVKAHCTFTGFSTSTRPDLRISFAKNGTNNNFYVADSIATNQIRMVFNIEEEFDVTTNDVITVHSRAIAQVGTIVLDAASAGVLRLERIE